MKTQLLPLVVHAGDTLVTILLTFSDARPIPITQAINLANAVAPRLPG